MTDFSDYIVYVDESGDHNLDNVYPDFPAFCLSFCVIKKSDYFSDIVPNFQRFKFDYWGYDTVILHESEIRKSKNAFTFLMTDKALRQGFYSELNELVSKSDFEIFSAVILKEKLKRRYTVPHNPYNIALLFCMEQLRLFLLGKGEAGKRIHVVFEGRGKAEDTELENEFRRICDNAGNWGYRKPDFRVMEFEPIFAPKSCNSAGLQLADLTARPIALNAFRPNQPNRAFDILKPKLTCKIFP